MCICACIVENFMAGCYFSSFFLLHIYMDVCLCVCARVCMYMLLRQMRDHVVLCRLPNDEKRGTIFSL